jgi:hypothetical protein
MNNISKLYKRVIDKKALKKIIAAETGRTESSIESNWLSTGNVPLHFEKRVHELMINFIKQEINKTKKIIK